MRLWLFLLLLFPTISWSQEKNIETVVQKGHIQPISVIAWHPSGNYFASGSVDHSIILWDYQTGKQIRSFNQHTGKIIDLHFSSDGEMILAAGMDNLISITECKSGDVLFTHTYKEVHSYPMSVSFSPKEDYVFIGDNRDRFTAIHLESKNTIHTKKGFSAPVSSANWSEDQIKIVDIKGYKGLHLIDRTTEDSTFISFDKPHYYAFNQYKEQLAVGSNKLIAGIYDTRTGELIKEMIAEKKCDGCKTKISFSPNGEYFATFSRDIGLTVYKTTNWKIIIQSDDQKEASNLLFSADSKWITIQEDKNFTHVNLKSGRSYSTLKGEDDLVKSYLHPSQPIQLVANDVFGIEARKISTNSTIKTFSGLLNDKKQQVESLNYSSWYSQNIINHLKLTPAADVNQTEELMAIGKLDTAVVIRNIKTGKFLPSFIHHSSPVFSITFHPTEPFIITGDAEGIVKLWNHEEQRLVWSFRPHVRYIFSMAFNAKGDELITSSWDGIVKHWHLSIDDPKPPALIDAIDFKNNTGFAVGFTPRDLYLAIGDVEKNMRLYEADTKSYIDKFKGHSRTISDFCFFTQNEHQRIATVSRDGWLKIWDFNTGTLLDKFSSPNQTAMLSIDHIPSRHLLMVGNANRSIYAYDYEKRSSPFSFTAHQAGVNWVHWNKTTDELLSKSTTGEIKHWKLHKDSVTLNYTLHMIDHQEWILMSPNGYFDGTSRAMQSINYVKGWQSLEIELFFDNYYTPQLFEQISSEKQLKDRGLNQMMNSIPTFNLKMNTFQDEIVDVQPDSTYNHSVSKLSLTVDYSATSADLESIAVFNNNKRTATIDFKGSPVFRGIKKEKQFDVSLVPGDNVIRVELITSQELRSPSQSVNIYYDTLLGKRELFIVSLGINKYENNNYNLNYAKNDAQSFTDQLNEGASPLFEDIHTLSLYNSNVTKKEVLASLKEFRSKIGPEDVFVFYYAGHGVMIPTPEESSSTFFLVMSDITNMYGDFKTVSNKGISGEELFQLAKEIPAQKQLFIIDACQSGGALKSGNFRGVEREKAIAKLARSSGTFFITASQEMEYANESSVLKHGVFTYAILELLDPDTEITKTIGSDDIISASELKSYVESRVPELSEKYKGSPQYPTGYSFGNDFPLVEKKK